MSATSISAEQRALELGLNLASTSGPAGNYAAAVRSGPWLVLSGKAPQAVNGQSPKGKLGGEYTADQGYALARSACIELLAAIRQALGSLDRVARVVDLQGALNTTPDFEDHARVLDGASDLLLQVFGPELGLHARGVIGVATLRKGLPLTLRATVEVRAG